MNKPSLRWFIKMDNYLLEKLLSKINFSIEPVLRGSAIIT